LSLKERWRGGGIGGLTLVVALSHLHLDQFLHVDIYESVVKLAEVAAGIALWLRTWEVLKDLGMAGDLEARLPPGEISPDLKKTKCDPCFLYQFRVLTFLWNQDWHFRSERAMNKLASHFLI
jgi:hypothetical protein